jgi:hypothetical protein
MGWGCLLHGSEVIFVSFEVLVERPDDPFHVPGTGNYPGRSDACWWKDVKEINDEFLTGVKYSHGVCVCALHDLIWYLDLDLLLCKRVLCLIRHEWLLVLEAGEKCPFAAFRSSPTLSRGQVSRTLALHLDSFHQPAKGVFWGTLSCGEVLMKKTYDTIH